MTAPRITDVCLVTSSLEEAVTYYTDKLGFALSSRMPGFADFTSSGVVLAVWDAEAIRTSTGVPVRTATPVEHSVMVAVELGSPEDVDATYERLSNRGVEFYRPPGTYPWNARCVYAPGPCGEFWEWFAWCEGGKPGAIS